MKVVLLQYNIVWESVEMNRKRLDDIFWNDSKMSGCDLIVLPEMFSTGFIVKPEGIAEPVVQSDGVPAGCCQTVEWMKDWSSRLGAAIAGSIAVEENGRYFNRFYFVKPDGSVSFYDKRHLFTYGGENLTYTPGESRVIVEWKGIRFLLLVCYDLRFPVWARNRKDYDAIIIVANWPKVRRYAWNTLLCARAIENQCYVLSVDRIGDDPSNHYNGGSYFIEPSGNVVAMVSDNDNTDSVYDSVCFELDADKLEGEYRKSFPVLDDADDFVIC